MSKPSRLGALVGALLLSLYWAPIANAQHADPSGRVARFSDTDGDISYSPAGEDDWISVVRNRPLITGDRLWTDSDARGEMQVGSAAVRLGPDTSVEILALDDSIAQFRLTQGTLNLRVRRMDSGQIYEVATPTLAFTVNRPGRYRIDVDARDQHTTIVVWEGAGTAYGERADFPLRAGDTVRFYDADLRDYKLFGLPREDDFDRYCFARDQRLDRSASLRYVDDDLVGYADLDEYGSWRPVRSYGDVWFPSRVDDGWAPYRDGHWMWQEPWGWTWVDDAPWGFAPSHYGRWVFVSSRWGWIPGPRHVRPVYAPALVAFVGGSGWSLSLSLGGGSPIGWFPLGPREVYVPSYRASRDYFTRVNVHNTVINNTTITNVYNNYQRGDTNVTQVNHVNREVAGAITAVPSEVFRNSRSVRKAAVRLDRNAATTGQITNVAPIAPSAQSVIGAGNAARSRPPREAVDRPVVARHAPPPRERPFAAREEQLKRSAGRVPEPIATEPARASSEATPGVRVIPEQRTPVNARAQGPRRRDAEPTTQTPGIRPPPSRDQPTDSPRQPGRETGDRTGANAPKTQGDAQTPTEREIRPQDRPPGPRDQSPPGGPARAREPRVLEPAPGSDVDSTPRSTVDERRSPMNAERRRNAQPGPDAGAIRPQSDREQPAASDTDPRRQAGDRYRNEPTQRSPGQAREPRAREPVPVPDVDSTPRRTVDQQPPPMNNRRPRAEAQPPPDARQARPLPPLDRAAESANGPRRRAEDRNRDQAPNRADDPQTRRHPGKAESEAQRLRREDPNAGTNAQ